MIRTLFALAILFASTLNAQAEGKKGAPTSVDLVLVLAVDVSGSISNERYKLQMDGYAAAFRSKEVVDAIVRNRQRIVVTMTHWASTTQQVQVTAWHVISSAKDAEVFAAVLESATRSFGGGYTGINAALVFATALIKNAPYTADRYIIDISGDGGENSGGVTASGRDHAVKNGITVNGLPIVAAEPGVVEYYGKNVIGGLGAFLVEANWDTFVQAVRMKIVWEISAIVPPRYAMLK